MMGSYSLVEIISLVQTQIAWQNAALFKEKKCFRPLQRDGVRLLNQRNSFSMLLCGEATLLLNN